MNFDLISSSSFFPNNVICEQPFWIFGLLSVTKLLWFEPNLIHQHWPWQSSLYKFHKNPISFLRKTIQTCNPPINMQISWLKRKKVIQFSSSLNSKARPIKQTDDFHSASACFSHLIIEFKSKQWVWGNEMNFSPLSWLKSSFCLNSKWDEATGWRCWLSTLSNLACPFV